MKPRVLVTGAGGFIGGFVCQGLASTGYAVRAALRNEDSRAPLADERIVVGEIGRATDWSAALANVDYVVHTAARVHMMADTAANADAYTETNALGTCALATAAANCGVRRLIFVSSVKVNGEEAGGHVYTATDPPHPQDDYGRSKWLAEQYLAQACADGRMEFAIVRPPLVFGPGVRANFLRLMRWIDRGYPLPFGAIGNRRSLVSVWNLADLIVNMLANAVAVNRTWMVSEGEDLSTGELVRRLARAMGRSARVVPIPERVLRLAGSILGRQAEVARLCGSLCVDVAPTFSLLGWKPPLDLDTGLARTAEWFGAGR